MADAPFGKLKNMLPSLAHKKEDPEIEDFSDEEDNSRGEIVNKKQHDVLLQLNIPSQTQLDAKILTPTKVKKVGFHTSEEGGYAFGEVEEFHQQVVKTVGWFADALFKRDNDVRTLATEVDKYITDFQNMKMDIELLENNAAANAINSDTSEVAELEDKLFKAERENTTLKAQNELLKAQIEELQHSNTQEEIQVPNTSGSLNNAEREHLEQMEAWAAQVQVLYTDMEEALENAQSENAELTEKVNALINQPSVPAEILEQIDELNSKLEEITAAYNELQERFIAMEEYANSAEQYSKEMQEYAQGLVEELERLQEGQEADPDEPEYEQATAPAPIEDKPSYRLPDGVSLDDL